MMAMILAAGRGDRLRPITDKTPKALLEIAGESLLERHLHMLAAAGINSAVINLGWLGEQIVDRIGDGHRYGLQVSYSPEFCNVLETAGGILRALPMLGGEPFWVINADVFTDLKLPDIALPKNVLGHVLLVPTPAFKSCGDFDLLNGSLANGVRPAYTFSGIACYRPEFFHRIPPGHAPLAPLLREAADNRELTAALLEGIWEDVGTTERLAGLRQRVEG